MTVVSREQAVGLATILRECADELEAADITEWASLHDMLNATLNNITHDYGESLGNNVQFFGGIKIVSVETMPALDEIVILRGGWDLPTLEPLFALARIQHISKGGKPPLFIVLNPDQEITTLEEEQMALFGWERKGAER
jgi:hypothetical protein